jgi:outer membrane protein W
VSPVQAKDVKNRWFVGGTLAYHTTEDAVSNNASMVGDPRPDDYVSRELTVDDTIQFDLLAGFGFTDRFSLQIEAGYFKGDVGSIDVYESKRYPANNDPLNPYNLNMTVTSDSSHPFTAGSLKQMPVGLTGIFRFRKDRTLNPFVGAGFGLVFMDFEPSDETFALNERLGHLVTTSVTDERGKELIPDFFKARVFEDGGLFRYHGVTFDADTSKEWHLSAGMEYEVGQRLGFVGEVRYTYFDTPLSLSLQGDTGDYPGSPPYPVNTHVGPEDQVIYHYYPQELYRPDGTLLIYNDRQVAPNPHIPSDPKGIRYDCVAGEIADINMDGQLDYCWSDNKDNPNDDPYGRLLIQSGVIHLSGFSVHLGLRWYF